MSILLKSVRTTNNWDCSWAQCGHHQNGSGIDTATVCACYDILIWWVHVYTVLTRRSFNFFKLFSLTLTDVFSDTCMWNVNKSILPVIVTSWFVITLLWSTDAFCIGTWFQISPYKYILLQQTLYYMYNCSSQISEFKMQDPCTKIGMCVPFEYVHIMPLVRLSSCTLDRLDCMTLNCLHTYTCVTYLLITIYFSQYQRTYT